MMEDRRKRAAGKVGLEVVGRQQRLALGEVMLDVRADFIELLSEGGKAIAAALFEEDMGRLCGERYARKGPEVGQARRWGQQRGQVVLGGRKVSLARPRARLGNEEVALPSYLRLQREDPLGERALEQMLVGVSTRNYWRSLEPLSGGLVESAAGKSSVSRRFVLKTEEQLEAALKKPLGDTHWAGVYIDGLHFAEHVVVVVLGVDASGKKHVLGLREGSTENSTLCKELLSNLVGRGLPADRALLTIIDGGKGLRKAVREVFGQHEVVQRCQVHKTRNVLDQLPEGKRSSVRAAMSQAYNAPSYNSALTQLKNLARVLAKDHPSAAESSPRRAGGDAHRQAAWAQRCAGEKPAHHQPGREPQRRHASRLSSREALARRRDGAPLGDGVRSRSRAASSPPQGPQVHAPLARSPSSARCSTRHRQRQENRVEIRPSPPLTVSTAGGTSLAWSLL